MLWLFQVPLTQTLWSDDFHGVWILLPFGSLTQAQGPLLEMGSKVCVRFCVSCCYLLCVLLHSWWRNSAADRSQVYSVAASQSLSPLKCFFMGPASISCPVLDLSSVSWVMTKKPMGIMLGWGQPKPVCRWDFQGRIKRSLQNKPNLQF